MLNVKLARNIGFCSGVKRAIDIVEETLSKGNGKVYSLGPVIHNPEVIKQLKAKNLSIINSLDNLEDSSTLILPSHGSPRHILNTARHKNLKLIDVTCPYVSLVHKICDKLHSENMGVVIIGDRKHPEVEALLDLAPGACVIENIQDIKSGVFSYKKIGIISQTTQTKDVFFQAVSKILQKNPFVKEVHVYNTVCLDTANRQDEVKALAGVVDALLIIGSRSSANTKRLLYIGSKINKKTYLIENERANLEKILKKAKKIGLISGASTPQWLVKEIIKKIKKR